MKDFGTTEFTWVDSMGVERTMNVKNRITYTEMGIVCEAVIIDAFANGRFHPYVVEPAFAAHLLSVCSDYKFDSLDELVEQLDTTNLLDCFALVDHEQIMSMRAFVDDMVKYEKKRSSMDRLCDYFVSLSKSGAAIKTVEDVAEVLAAHTAAKPTAE